MWHRLQCRTQISYEIGGNPLFVFLGDIIEIFSYSEIRCLVSADANQYRSR